MAHIGPQSEEGCDQRFSTGWFCLIKIWPKLSVGQICIYV
ncbi:hypothetical protein HMPREF1248_0303 [Coriobacteriaceae bacterium BV3Ac1]|nr:hypothetical protein HMPREF1248_0303 [Coriobacteriaceae bacterium BV3Ac1]